MTKNWQLGKECCQGAKEEPRSVRNLTAKQPTATHMPSYKPLSSQRKATTLAKDVLHAQAAFTQGAEEPVEVDFRLHFCQDWSSRDATMSPKGSPPCATPRALTPHPCEATAWQTGKLDQCAVHLPPPTPCGFNQWRIKVCLYMGACIHKLAEIATEVKIPSSSGKIPCDSTEPGCWEGRRQLGTLHPNPSGNQLLPIAPLPIHKKHPESGASCHHLQLSLCLHKHPSAFTAYA